MSAERDEAERELRRAEEELDRTYRQATRLNVALLLGLVWGLFVLMVLLAAQP